MKGDLGVRLETDGAVHDMDTGILENLGPVDVVLLVEARRQLDQRHHLLARLGGAGEGADDGTDRARGAVQGLLDGEDTRVLGGSLDERLDRVLEAVVRVVDEDVLVAEVAEEVRLAGPQLRCGLCRRHRRPGPELQLGAIQLADVEEAAQVEGPGDGVDIPGLDVELADEQVDEHRRHVRAHLHAHHQGGTAALLEDGSHRFHEVVGLVVTVELVVRVPGQSEDVVGDHLHAFEEVLEMGGDDLLDGDETLAVGEDDEAAEQRWHLDAGDPFLAGRRVGDDDHQVEGEAGDVGEWVAGVDGEWCEHREDPLLEHGVEEGPVGVVQRRPVAEADGVGVQVGCQAVEEDPTLAGIEFLHLGSDRLHLRPGARRIAGTSLEPGGDLLLEPADAHLEKLVESPAGDGEEARPLQNRQALVLGQGQDTGVEIEPGQLAVEQSRRRRRGGRKFPVAFQRELQRGLQ